MLQTVTIKDFIIVDFLELELKPGFNVFSGETGAGKSIILDAFGLAFGNRAEQGLVRTGAKHCDISISFDLSDKPELFDWLDQHGFDADGECIMNRRISTDGKSKATINGIPATLTIVRELAQLLVQAHSQHQHQLLQKPSQQQQLLDRFGKHQPLLDQLALLAKDYRQAKQQLDQLLAKAEHRNDEQRLLEYQVNELTALNLQENEWQQINNEHKKLHQAKGLIDALNHSIVLTHEHDQHNAVNLLQQALDQLNDFHFDDSELNNARELLNTALIHASEAGMALNHVRDTLDLSPERLKELEDRISIIYDLARKHHINAEDLHEQSHSLQQQLDELQQMDERIAGLNTQIETITSDYQKYASTLHNKRQKAAKDLQQRVTDLMQNLNMPKSQFEIRLVAHQHAVHALGTETIEFWLTTNPGQPLQPLSKAASGGELSRILLAIHACLGASDIIPTLVFDEIDSGISGKTADAVARLTEALSQHHQIIAITHLPQVAARASSHFLVEKTLGDDSTFTHIRALNSQEHIEEVARMLAGSQINKQAIAQAKALVSG